MSESDWLFFLDADDLMHPKALQAVEPYINEYDAIFGQIVEMDSGCIRERYQVPEIPDYRTLLSFDPYLMIQMGHFVRRDVFEKLKFDESMNCGEDWDYFLRLWKEYRATKISEPLMINCKGMHSKGPKSATGQEWVRVVEDMLEAARMEDAA